MTLRFYPCQPRLWTGYYRRIPGDTTAFHVPSDADGPVRPFAYLDLEEGRGHCTLVESDAAYALAKSINRAKRRLGALNGGGSFLINEFGQVLVPAPDGSGNIALAGEVRGELEFENPFQPGKTLNLATNEGLTTGDPWNRPYVGMWYNLSKRDEIYRMRSTADLQIKETPPRQDAALIRKLRSLRPIGSVRFIVNPHGIVLTKIQTEGTYAISEDSWPAVYVGRINPQRWFQKEE